MGVRTTSVEHPPFDRTDLDPGSRRSFGRGKEFHRSEDFHFKLGQGEVGRSEFLAGTSLCFFWGGEGGCLFLAMALLRTGGWGGGEQISTRLLNFEGGWVASIPFWPTHIASYRLMKALLDKSMFGLRLHPTVESGLFSPMKKIRGSMSIQPLCHLGVQPT